MNEYDNSCIADKTKLYYLQYKQELPTELPVPQVYNSIEESRNGVGGGCPRVNCTDISGDWQDTTNRQVLTSFVVVTMRVYC